MIKVCNFVCRIMVVTAVGALSDSVLQIGNVEAAKQANNETKNEVSKWLRKSPHNAFVIMEKGLKDVYGDHIGELTDIFKREQTATAKILADAVSAGTIPVMVYGAHIILHIPNAFFTNLSLIPAATAARFTNSQKDAWVKIVNANGAFSVQ